MWHRNISMAKNEGMVTTIKFFIKEIGKKFFGYYVIIFLQAALRAAIFLIDVVFPAAIIDAVLSLDTRLIMRCVLLYLIAKATVSLGRNFVDYFNNIREKKIDQYFDRLFRKKVMSAPFSFIEQASNQNKIQYANNCYKYYSLGIKGLVGNIINILTALFTLSGVLYIANKYSVLLLISIPLNVASVILQKKINKNISEFNSNISINNRSRNYMYYEITELKYGLDIRIYNAASKFLKKIQDFNSSAINNEKKLLYKNIPFHILRTMISVGISFAFYVTVTVQLFFKYISISRFTVLISALNCFQTSLMQCISAIQDIQFRVKYLNEFTKLLSLIDQEKQKADGTEQISSIEEIEFKDIEFKYPNMKESVLSQFNLSIKNGEKIAIVGRNGSGKTTLIKLLCVLYQPDGGEILINQRKIQNISKSMYLKQLSAVFQDYQIFAFSLRDNLVLDNAPNILESKIEEALKLLDLEKVCLSLKKGMDTNLSKQYADEGVELSGGENQKVAIARAWLRDADVIILDEPTAALDPIAEYNVYNHFNTIAEKKTTIYISHRLSACKFADKIAVINEGKLEEYGTHTELMKRKGIYYTMYQTQAQYYADVH